MADLKDGMVGREWWESSARTGAEKACFDYEKRESLERSTFKNAGKESKGC